MAESRILLSSCLAGINCRYDGGNCRVERLVDLVRKGRAIFICPEQAAGLPTPREPAEIEPGMSAEDVLTGLGRVLTKSGMDATHDYVEGAKATLALCQDLKIRTAIMKAGSPSCGSRRQYDGTFSGKLIPGAGVTAELLRQNGIQVYDEENFPQDLRD